MAWEMPEEGQRVLRPILNKQASAERRHKNYRRKWNHWFSLYRNQAEFRRWYQTANQSERDTGLRDAQREWGATLVMPYAWEVVETINPRMASNRPRMLILPRGDTPEENCANMKIVIDAQQEQVSYELKAQETGKSGLIYGLGVEKHYWRTERYPVPVIEPGMSGPVLGQRLCGHDDPDCENVDIFDFYWDPFAADLSRARWAIHRTWRDTDYCVKMLVRRKWNNPFALPPSEIAGSGGSQRFDEIHRQRLETAGHSDFDADDQMREVWEYHGENGQVVTVLDRQWIVQTGVKDRPRVDQTFAAYRPMTQGIQELPGIGAIESIEHLQHEASAFRSLRLDNAKFAVNRAFFYADGMLDTDDLKIGPGVGVPVLGDPRDVLFPWPVQDIPASSYQEMSELKADIDRASGISDTVTGAGGAGETATGVQLVQAAASIRIQNMAHRLEVETIQKAGEIWLSLNQWKIRTNRSVPVPADPATAGEDQKWTIRKVGPAELAGPMFVAVEGGSTQPENPAEKLQRAQIKSQLFRGDPSIDQRVLARDVLKDLGVRQPDAWLAPPGPSGEAMAAAMEQIGQELSDNGKPGSVPLTREVIAQIAERAMMLDQQAKDQAQGAQPATEG